MQFLHMQEFRQIDTFSMGIDMIELFLSPSTHSGRKSRFLLLYTSLIDISGYQLGIGSQFVKAHNIENPANNQKIFQIRFVSNLDF